MGWKRRLKAAARREQQALPLRGLRSRRMSLVAADASLLESDLAKSAALGDRLGASVPDNWPPVLYGRPAIELALRQLADPAEQGWSFWYLLTREESGQQLLGICDFKGRPDVKGSVEIAYSVLAQFRNRGLATEAVQTLLAWAFSHQNVREVSAKTLPHLQQSIRVMKKNGFAPAGEGPERGVIRYVVLRPDCR